MRDLFARISIATVFVAVLSLSALPHAWANGRGFFEDLEDDEADVGPPYFGFVKDTGGKFLANAAITATIKSMNSSISVHTDVQGHYRIPGFSKDVDPKEVDITCNMEGYKLVNRLRRPTPNNGPIEVSCTMAKE